MHETDYDVVVVGGGAAGLSGALILGRARRSVLVLDAGDPRNAPAAGVHGLLGRDGIAPAALLDAARADLAPYGVRVERARATAAGRDGEALAVTLEDGRRIRARRLLVATGLRDELPDLPGLAERWGRDVLHCPYCHGWEVRDQPLAVLGSAPWSARKALLVRQWTDDLTYLVHTAPDPTDEEAEQLAARGVRVVAGPVAAIEVADDRLSGVLLADGNVVPLRALVVAPRMVARAGLLDGLGLRPVADPHGIGERIEADPSGRTAAAGVWVAGNVHDPMAQVVSAADQGVRAAAAINQDLVDEDVRRALAAGTVAA
ncbi:NAD(P)/FAD-dependent oxidoreductase [Patulibacter defluvii]|uniref:NAD(P)/FAD-dependent oxidoreductase n=1 Tax=Patulibacter defluvii TaxID=3095358 RepID=UPI002A75CCF0|nr:NAD(P)/FAD-dependent oxidoreductase [Patulibacter sp. DM4]